MGLPPVEFADSNGRKSTGPGHVPNGNGTLPPISPMSGVGVAPPHHAGDSDSDCESPIRGSSSRASVSLPMLQEQVVLGPLGTFASSSNFQNFTLFVIVLNGLWIGVDVEWNHESLRKNDKLPLEPLSVIVEHAFCFYFTFEILVRIFAFGKGNMKDPWFLFDFVLVLFMVIETWVMAIIEAIMGGGADGILSKFSCLRLLRLTRLTRIMTSLPELLTIVRGIVNATKSVTIVLLFMVLLMYVFAIVFTAQIGDPDAPEHDLEPYWVRDDDPTGVELFGTMFDSMMSLFTRGLLGDNLAETLVAIKDMGGANAYACEMGEDDDGNPAETCTRSGGELWLMWVFILFMCLSAFCLLNMLVGVLCEVIAETAKEEDESNQISDLQMNIYDSFKAIDESGDNIISKTEWAHMRATESVRKSFLRIGVEENFMEIRLDQIEEHLFGRLDKHTLLLEDGWKPKKDQIEHDKTAAEGGAIPLEEFFAQILEIRPDADASYLDLVILQTRAQRDEALFGAQLDHIERMLKRGLPCPESAIIGNTEGYENPGENTTAVENMILTRPHLAGLDNSTHFTPLKKDEELNNGTSPAADPWLQGLSTDVLFAELIHRASLPDNSSHPAIDVY